MEPLDNMMWHAFSGPQHDITEGNELARRFPPEIGPFCAVPDGPTREHYDALAALVGPGGVATILRGEMTVPDGWESLGTFDGVQMVTSATTGTRWEDSRIAVLSKDDVDEMVDLTSRTKPGPFATRTSELGTYLGIHVDGRLVAMAGQRAQTDHYVEISAVCTDDAFVGRGFGAALVEAQIDLISAMGKVPMLHTAGNNVRAIALYERLGFVLRRHVDVVIMRARGNTSKQ